MNLLDYLGSWGILIGLFVANIAGLAGGGIVIPLCMAFFGMDTKNGIALSNFS